MSEKVSKEYWVLSSIIRQWNQGKRNAGYSYVITDAITGNMREYAISKISESSDIYEDAKAIQEAFRISPDKLTGTVNNLHRPFSRNLLRFFFRIGVYGDDEKAGEIWTFICRFHFKRRKPTTEEEIRGNEIINRMIIPWLRKNIWEHINDEEYTLSFSIPELLWMKIAKEELQKAPLAAWQEPHTVLLDQFLYPSVRKHILGENWNPYSDYKGVIYGICHAVILNAISEYEKKNNLPSISEKVLCYEVEWECRNARCPAWTLKSSLACFGSSYCSPWIKNHDRWDTAKGVIKTCYDNPYTGEPS